MSASAIGLMAAIQVDSHARPRWSRRRSSLARIAPNCTESRQNLPNSANMLRIYVAERVGFEPTCRLPDKTLSRRPRYDHFGTSPSRCEQAAWPAGRARDRPGLYRTVRAVMLMARAWLRGAR